MAGVRGFKRVGPILRHESRGSVCGFQSFFGALLTNYAAINVLLEQNAFLKVVALISFVAFLISIYYAFLCLIPRLDLKQSYRHSIIYFDDIRREKLDDFSEKLLDNLEDARKMHDTLAYQIWINSHIAAEKYRYVTRSIRFSFLSSFVLATGFFLNLIFL